MYYTLHRIKTGPGSLLSGLILISVLLNSCQGSVSNTAKRPEQPEVPGISYAKRLKIESLNGYSRVSVIGPWQGSGGVIQDWYLLPRGISIPSHIDSMKVIRIPVERVVCMSSTHIAMIKALGRSESVRGFSGTGFIYDEQVRKLVADGEIRETGYEDNLNKELILSLLPDVVIAYGIGSESAGYLGKLKEMGVKVLFNADYLEEDPLGKAEWIRLFGALYDCSPVADSLFQHIVHEYNRYKSLIAEKASGKPRILLGLPFRDTWFISPGNSYISRLISDAGGEYLWEDSVSDVSMPMGLENVFIKAVSADYWLNTGSAGSLQEIAAVDPRLARLPCFRSGRLYNNNRRMSPEGGNDYWESGCLNPHIILRDIASVIHPGLFSGEELYYYIKLK
ncbi:MAG: ABC transporter substrate-binding protein [Bacteroidales bacterium]